MKHWVTKEIVRRQINVDSKWYLQGKIQYSSVAVYEPVEASSAAWSQWEHEKQSTAAASCFFGDEMDEQLAVWEQITNQSFFSLQY